MPNVRRGEVWQVDFGLVAKVRPALVLGCDIADEDRVLAAVVYHTTALRGSRYEVPMRVPGLEEGGFDAQGLKGSAALTGHAHAGSWCRSA
jgi:mRNA interferase MazF